MKRRSVIIAGHKTSVSLEEAFWDGLKDAARVKQMHLCDLIALIDINRKHANLSAAIRLFVLDFYQLNKVTPAGGKSLVMRNGRPSLLRTG
jgi:predicted DNA-binding ribbon-helix-helix protein